MIDKEKIVNGIKHCMTDKTNVKQCGGCPYKDYSFCENRLGSDILALLKEQEAKTGHWISIDDGDVVTIDNDGFPEKACFCSECKKYLTASDEYAVYGRYCPFCGAKMEGR